MTQLEQNRRDLAADIFRASYLEGSFVLRSGAVSGHYFDKYLFESDPELLDRIVAALAPLVPSDTDVIAGLETGGIPLAVLLSQRTGLPTRYVRKAPKEYGTRKLAEGGEIDGLRVLVIEDVVTSGGQVLSSSRDLRARGAVISTALCVIDRESGGSEALQTEGIALQSLFRMNDLMEAGQAKGRS